MTEVDGDPATRDSDSGALQPASFLQHANTLLATATQTATLIVIACAPSVAPERLRQLKHDLAMFGDIGKLGPRASLRVIASTPRASRLAVLVVDQAQHLLARAVTAALAAGDAAGLTAAIYARCVPTTFAQLRSDAEALLELALENGQHIETNQFADRAPPPAWDALGFRGTASDVVPHSVRGHALLFRFCQRLQPTHWIRVHTDGDLEFHDISASDVTTMTAVPRLIEPRQLVAIANAWRSFICQAEVLELYDPQASPATSAATSASPTAKTITASDDGTYWLEAFCHGTRERTTGVVRASAAVKALLATITAAVTATRNA
ncbi:MAG: hypothetical protein KBG15_20090 [Kofleriaceae bacterium]|nr:hypothetical protein [Kofleriaceae bacterium]